MGTALALAWSIISGGFKAVFGFLTKVISDPTLRTIAIIVIAGVILWMEHRNVLAARADMAAYKVRADAFMTTEQKAFATEYALYHATLRNRDLDNTVALADAAGQSKECTARVAETRRADNAINDLINKAAPHDPKAPAVPGPRLYDDGELCRALGVPCS